MLMFLSVVLFSASLAYLCWFTYECNAKIHELKEAVKTLQEELAKKPEPPKPKAKVLKKKKTEGTPISRGKT